MNKAKARNRMSVAVGIVAAVITLGSGVAMAASKSGQQDFINYCGACHGADGKGDGPVASALDGKPSDLTLLAKNNKGYFPFLRVRQVIDGRPDAGNIRAHSSKEMPIWGDVFTEELASTGAENVFAKAKILNIIDYLAAIQQ